MEPSTSSTSVIPTNPPEQGKEQDQQQELTDNFYELIKKINLKKISTTVMIESMKRIFNTLKDDDFILKRLTYIYI